MILGRGIRDVVHEHSQRMAGQIEAQFPEHLHLGKPVEIIAVGIELVALTVVWREHRCAALRVAEFMHTGSSGKGHAPGR